jgi:transposase
MRAYSADLRTRVLAAVDAGKMNRWEIAGLFQVSLSWIRRLVQRRRETGTIEPRQQRHGRLPKIDEAQQERLCELVQADPDATLAELRERLAVGVSVTTLWRELTKMGISLKKKTVHASEQDRPDVQQQRQEFQEKISHTTVDQLVFIDEAGAATNMTRTHGRGPQGERVVDKVPKGHWHITTMIGAIGITGVIAGLIFEGATDAEAFATFVEEILIHQLQPGQIVIMDNLSSHKSARVERAINRVGAEVLWLPPYSPDFNPIEKMWSKMKSLLRSAAKRTVGDLWDAICAAYHKMTASDCQGYFGSCGYQVAATTM